VVKTCHLTMVVCCVIGTCGNTKKTNKNLSFHQLPLVYYWREEWKKIINLNGGVHSNTKENGDSSFCVCSEHFTPDSYKPSGYRRLKEDAVPSIFSSSHRKRPPHLRSSGVKTTYPLMALIYISGNLSKPTSKTTTLMSPSCFLDRGALKYPTHEFVARLWTVYKFISRAISLLAGTNYLLDDLVEFLTPNLEQCSTFICELEEKIMKLLHFVCGNSYPQY
jgi:hypothetical protein